MTGSESTPIGVSTFRPELTLLKAGNPDVLLVVHVGVSLVNALNQGRQLGFTGQFLTVNEAEEQEVLEGAKGSAEGMKYLAPEPAMETAAMQAFARAFGQHFKRLPHPLSRHSYDATILTARALHECGRDRRCAKERLYRTKDYPGASGNFSIERDGGTKRAFVLKTVQDRRFVAAH